MFCDDPLTPVRVSYTAQPDVHTQQPELHERGHDSGRGCTG